MIRIRIFQLLEVLFESIEEAASRARDKVAVCQRCGNLRSGAACPDRMRTSRAATLWTVNSIWRYI